MWTEGAARGTQGRRQRAPRVGVPAAGTPAPAQTSALTPCGWQGEEPRTPLAGEGERVLHAKCRGAPWMDSRGRSQAPPASSVAPDLHARKRPPPWARGTRCRSHSSVARGRDRRTATVCRRQAAKRRTEASRGNRPDTVNKDVSHGQKRERAASEHGRRDGTRTRPLDHPRRPGTRSRNTEKSIG